MGFFVLQGLDFLKALFGYELAFIDMNTRLLCARSWGRCHWAVIKELELATPNSPVFCLGFLNALGHVLPTVSAALEMHHVMMWTCSEKCIIRPVVRCMKVIKPAYVNPDGKAYHNQKLHDSHTHVWGYFQKLTEKESWKTWYFGAKKVIIFPSHAFHELLKGHFFRVLAHCCKDHNEQGSMRFNQA